MPWPCSVFVITSRAPISRWNTPPSVKLTAWRRAKHSSSVPSGGMRWFIRPGKLADLGVKRAAQGHVHLLKATADAQERLAPVDAGADQRQRDRIAAAVKGTMRRGFLLAIFAGVDVRAAPRSRGTRRKGPAVHRPRHSADRIGMISGRQPATSATAAEFIVPPECTGIAVVDPVAVADDPDDRSSGPNPSTCVTE